MVRTTVDVSAGSGTLDFGPRDFRLSGTGRLRLQGGDTVDIRAHTIVLEAGALIAHAEPDPVTHGAHLTLTATEDVQLQRTGQSRAIIDLSSDVQAGAIRLHAGGNLDVSGNLRVKGGGAVAGDGVIEITADRGDATLGGDFSLRGATGGTGGDFSASAPLGRLVLTGDVDVSGGSEGGSIDLGAGPFLSTTGTLDATGNSFGADGGSVTIGATGDVTLGGNIMTLGAGGLSFEGALAGEVTVTAGGILVVGATITSFGGGDSGQGAAIDLQAGPLLTITAPIDVQAPRGDGGSVSAEADEVRVQAEINADGSDGGDVTFTTARLGRSTVGGPVTVTGNVHAGGGGSITIEGCDVGVPAAGRLTTNGAPAGENLIQASGLMTVAGRLSAQPDGRNRLLFRDPGRPPITAGANIQPGAIQEEVSTLRPCAGAPVCGNGVREPGEGCDDQDTDRCDGCSATCQVEACGNGRPECDEACDDGNVVEGDVCDSNCTRPACGNGIVAGTEECDDGNRTAGDGCDESCRIERPVGCGDGTTQPPEQCDDGNDRPCDGCDLCVLEGCGNGIVECGEECDDGNATDGDCCSARCRLEPGLDLDGDGTKQVATDVVYVARYLLGLSPVPPSFRVGHPTIPPDETIAARVESARSLLDVDGNGTVAVATDIVYVARHLLGLSPVPPSFRVGHPEIPPDDSIAQKIDASCPRAQSPYLVKDVNPGAGASDPAHLTSVGGVLFFAASDGSTGMELWKSDGSAAGTVLVGDINPGPAESSPQELADADGTLFLTASDGQNGRELWKSDGSAAGTVLVSDINPGAGNATPLFPLNVNGTLFFSAFDGSTGRELWKSDGTAAATVPVADINPGSGSSSPQLLTRLNATVLFSAFNGSTGVELWKSDGTAITTAEVLDIHAGGPGSAPAGLTQVNGAIFFSANDGTGPELWKSDGTPAGTKQVADINPGLGGSSPSNLTAVAGTLFFSANDASVGLELWRTDGTAAVRVADINPGAAGSSPSNLTAVGGTLFFGADDGSTGAELWKSDGTPAGTVQLADINPGAGGSSPSNLTAVGDTLVFAADDGSAGVELWRSDGTPAGTTRVADINPGAGSSSPSNLIAVGGTLFFAADDGSTGVELWALRPGPSTTATTTTATTTTTTTLPDPLVGDWHFSGEGSENCSAFEPHVEVSFHLERFGTTLSGSWFLDEPAPGLGTVLGPDAFRFALRGPARRHFCTITSLTLTAEEVGGDARATLTATAFCQGRECGGEWMGPLEKRPAPRADVEA